MKNGQSNVLYLDARERMEHADAAAAEKRRVQIANGLRRPSAVRSGIGGFVFAAAAIALGFVLALASLAAAQPVPDAAVAVVDAAPAVALDAAPTPAEAGSGVGTTKPHETIDDPTVAPAKYVDDVLAAKRQGWALAILVALFGALIALIRLGWLKRISERAAAIAVSAAAVLASVIDALMLGGTWLAAAFAGAGALLLLFTPKTKT